MNQKSKSTGSEENEIQARERQVRKDEDGVVLTGTLMDKSNNWPGVLKNCRSKEEAIAETASELADKGKKQRRKKTWTDATRL